MDLKALVSSAEFFLEAAGVCVIALGAIYSSLLALVALCKRQPRQDLFTSYRQNLGRGSLLGLELLVGADIIKTVAIEPTIRSAAVLAMIVLIRTFLSFTLEMETSGRWPWQSSSAGKAN